MQQTSGSTLSSARRQVVTVLVSAGAIFAILLAVFASSYTMMAIGIGVAIVVTFAVVSVVSRAVVAPIERLARDAAEVATGETLHRVEVHATNELKGLGDSFNELAKRTRESERKLEQMREMEERLKEAQTTAGEIQLSYSNSVALGEIGQEITSMLKIEDIVNTLHESITSMMDASIFGLGIYEPEREALRVERFVEREGRNATFYIPMSDKGSLAVWCATNRKEIFLNDVENDYARYVYPLSIPLGGPVPGSVIFCPMVVGDHMIGVISVQSFRKNAYTKHHLDMIRALASYTAVAQDNANAYEQLNSTLEDLKTAQTQLVQQEKMASLGQLTAGIAHEINNPINFVSANVKPLQRDIKSLLEILDKYNEIDPGNGVAEKLAEISELKEEIELDYVIDEINSLIRGIEDGARRTTEIVKGLRNFSRLDESDLKKADINEGIESTLVLLHNTYKERVEVTREYGPIPEIECYPGQLNQVFMNLLTNAVQAIEGKGTIRVKTEPAGDRIKIMISDSGKGIPQSLRDKIFDPFFTTKDVGEGTGLGLSISLGIIKKHSGTIDVDSEPGKGTTFILTLPIHQGDVAGV